MIYLKQTTANLKLYYATCFTIVAGVIIFGGLLAPSVSFFLYFYCSALSDIYFSFFILLQRLPQLKLGKMY